MEPEREDERLRGCLQGRRRPAAGLRSDPSCGSELPVSHIGNFPLVIVPFVSVGVCTLSIVHVSVCACLEFPILSVVPHVLSPPAPIRTGS